MLEELVVVVAAAAVAIVALKPALFRELEPRHVCDQCLVHV
jgi:hypothetical protein